MLFRGKVIEFKTTPSFGVLRRFAKEYKKEGFSKTTIQWRIQTLRNGWRRLAWYGEAIPVQQDLHKIKINSMDW